MPWIWSWKERLICFSSCRAFSNKVFSTLVLFKFVCVWLAKLSNPVSSFFKAIFSSLNNQKTYPSKLKEVRMKVIDAILTAIFVASFLYKGLVIEPLYHLCIYGMMGGIHYFTLANHKYLRRFMFDTKPLGYFIR